MKKVFLILIVILCGLGITGYKVYDRYYYNRELLIVMDSNKIQGNAYHRDDCKLLKSSLGKMTIVSKEFVARNELRACHTCNPPYDVKYVLEIREIKEQEAIVQRARDAELAKKREIQAQQDKLAQLEKNKERFLSGSGFILFGVADELLEKGYISKEQYIEGMKRRGLEKYIKQ